VFWKGLEAVMRSVGGQWRKMWLEEKYERTAQ
jgi:hypothetical protein